MPYCFILHDLLLYCWIPCFFRCIAYDLLLLIYCRIPYKLFLYFTWLIAVISMSYCFILHDLLLLSLCLIALFYMAYFLQRQFRFKGIHKVRERNVFSFGMVMYVFLMHSMIAWVILLVIVVGKMDYSMFPVCLLFMFRHSLLIHGKVIIILLFKSVFFAALLLSCFAYYKTRYFLCLAR